MTNDELSWKYWFLRGGMVLSLGLLITMVFKLAVIRHDFFKVKARDNKVFDMVIPAPRGKIVDSKGRLVAESVYRYFKLDDESNKLYQGLGEFEGYKFEGKDLAFDLQRRYWFGEAMGIVTGYVGKPTREELANKWCGENLNNESWIGRGGLEAALDCRLRGKDGKRLIEVDAKGEYIREMGRVDPVAGEDLKLSLDAYWQKRVYEMVADREEQVVVVASRPDSGEILFLVSSPSFEANYFTFERSEEKITSYLQDAEGRPLLNRAVAARYQPGSVFKMVVAAAGLETATINAETEFEDTGVIKVGEYSYKNWLWTKRGGTDGMVNLVKGLQRSNDIYFYRLGEKLGVDNIKTWANKFGLGQKTGIELPGELEGVVPDEEWKIKNKGERWYLGNTYHLAIGQGDLSVTPLQINRMTSVIANGGKRCRMTLVEGEGMCEEVGLSAKSVQKITEGMVAACQNGGTAWPLFNFKTKLACKTGTAEVGDGSKDTHAWLTVFGPVDNPEISLTVLVERGGEGSDEAAPIAGDILKEWFDEPDTLVPRYEEKKEE